MIAAISLNFQYIMYIASFSYGFYHLGDGELRILIVIGHLFWHMSVQFMVQEPWLMKWKNKKEISISPYIKCYTPKESKRE